MYSQKVDLQNCISLLEQHQQVIRVKSEVNPVHELSGIAKKLEGGPVIVFEHVKGSCFPVVTGLYGNRDNLALIFGCTAADLPFYLDRAVQEWLRNPVEPVIVDHAPSQEVIQEKPNLYEIPTPTISLEDGGPYYASSLVIAKDPDTGVRNASVHRIMVTGKDRLTMLLGTGGHLKDYFERAEKQGKSVEITINNGVDPLAFFASIIPSTSVPIDRDELGIVSSLLGHPMELCRSKTVSVEGIANAQVIIEGEILPGVREPEGPFGEVTGYYGTRADRWAVRVKAITRRREPIISALLPSKESYVALGVPMEAGLYRMVSNAVTGVKAVRMHDGGCGTYHAVIQMEPARAGMGKVAICAAFAASPSIQMVTVVNEDVDLSSAEDLMWAMSTRFSPDEDTVLIPNMSSQTINPISANGCSAKIGFDCTVPVPRTDRFKRAAYQEVDLSQYDIVYPGYKMGR
ncbi:UbiD family decarboxylase [Clostridium sp. AM58-1XD]|uniref:UbiD family decarboxylase n=1 Tax=Clostridium sp. AM58-1XD TaxID=2292307 RepID=UPI000E4A3F85|nr:UbiD family decarboxylase [Clostridium sp. AM58-1XD]RGY98737.1 UbiD family decarboxylase [Clostridium sp. AM58-1XD]